MSKDKTQPTFDDFFNNQGEPNEPDKMTTLDDFFKETLIKSILEKFHLLLKHPQSQKLPGNPYLDNSDYDRYTNQLAEYDDGQAEVDIYNQSHPDDSEPHRPKGRSFTSELCLDC